MADLTLKQAAAEVVKRLKAADFTIQRYDSYSTKSIYLKLDYGVANSIRISDHGGKQHLHYRFNLLSTTRSHYISTDGKFPRNFYGFNNIDKLIDDVLENRDRLVERYGMPNYLKYMERNRLDNKDAGRGFWAQAKLV